MLKKRDQVNEREEKRETTHFPLCPFVITVETTMKT